MKQLYLILFIFSICFNSKAQTYTNEGVIVKEGVFDVSPTGAATYTVPIETPPGVNGTEPNISLTYNSQSGSGLAGWGWNIAGLSSITRVPSTMYHDGKIGKINFDSNDRYALDGQRLIVKNNIYGHSSATYKTEVFSNLKIVSSGRKHRDESLSVLAGPDAFTVYHPNGTISYYGYSTKYNSGADGLLEWRLYYTIDQQGNFIQYFYTKKNNLVYISRIKYGNVYRQSSANNIYFHYELRNRPEIFYVGGKKFKHDLILKRIEVKGTGNQVYRKYLLSHNTTRIGYQRLGSIKFAGTDENYKSPLTFQYGKNVSPNSAIDRKQVINKNSNSTLFKRKRGIETGDFNGDGSIDFVSYNVDTKDKLWLHTNNFDNASTQNKILVKQTKFADVIASTLMTTDGKVMQEQGITVVTEDIKSTSATVNFATYKKNYYQYERSVTFSNRPKQFRYTPGDFNGDGITDVMISVWYENNYWPPQVYFVDLKRGTTSQPVGVAGFSAFVNTKDYAYDYNGDGKTNLVRVADEFVQIYSYESNELRVIAYIENQNIKLDKPIVLGDFNGDGNMDFMTPTVENSTVWNFFTSTAERVYPTNANTTQHGIHSYQKDIGIKYQKDSEKISNRRRIKHKYYYLAHDFNGDGKADILKQETKFTETQYTVESTTNKLELYTNIQVLKGAPTPSFELFHTNSKTFNRSDGEIMKDGVPIFLEANLTNGVLEYIYFDNNNQIFPFEFSYDHKEDVLLHKVRNAMGAETEFWYKSLNTGSIYTADNSEKYPYINVNVAPSLKVVERLSRFVHNDYMQKAFRYGGAVAHTQGLGFLGFKTVQRTDWYGVDTNEIWNTSKQDMQKRGAVIEQWAAFSNTSNLPSNYISRTQHNYSESTTNDGEYKLSLSNTEIDDKLKGTKVQTHYTYNEYSNVKNVINYFYEGTNLIGSDKTYYEEYSNNPTATNYTYHIGRPLKVRNEKYINGSTTFKTYKEYGYNNNLMTQSKIKKNNANWLTETFNHDPLGNITQKTISGEGIANRIEKFKYDHSGRFIEESTDILGLKTTYTYDNVTGDLKTKTSPYGHTSTYKYDAWGRILEATNYLGKTTKHYYNKTSNHLLKITDYPNGQDEMIYSDQNGLVTKTKKLSLNNKWITKSYEYDAIGRQVKESEPYFDNESPSQWNRTTYDEYGRPIKQELYTGKTINTSYNGLSSTVNDGFKSTTVTKDALGNTVRLQDQGGTINYTYFSNGTMKTANYGGLTVTTTIDDWGRKKSLNDPSAGIYNYEYNILGENTKETTPKGITTYTLDNFGRVTEKTIIGDQTDLSLSYTYDSSTKMLKKMIGTDNITNGGENYTYTYTYDNYQRIKQVKEETPFAMFIKTSTYDTYGRIATESYNVGSGFPFNSGVTTLNVYDAAGILQEIKDNTTQSTLWKINSENARQQPLNMSLGNGYTKRRGYDAHGFLTNIQDSKFIFGSGGLAALSYALKMEYDFNTQRGTLESRTNHLFKDHNANTWTENFTYDAQDRLTGISGAVQHTQNYDNRGRITYNNTLGNYKYNDGPISGPQSSVPSYQLKKIELNNQGDLYYQQHKLQNVTYNAFKKPVKISEEGKGKVDFVYGPLMNRTKAFYGGDNEELTQRKYTKYYSSIMPTEITDYKDLAANGTVRKIVTYIGGNGYTAPVAHINYQGSITIPPDYTNYIYLHRDYLGSILAITNGNGKIIEKRQFGAWGEVDKFVDAGKNTTFSHSSIIDRGYTGHEHFFEVGLIHMNGRIYDPHLKRFLSPDNYIQDPYNTQNFNRYGYVLNNPLSYNDPSGEFWQILVGGAINWAMNGAKFNGEGLASFTVGAMAGQFGAITGSIAGSTIGFTGGAISGSVSGFTGGFMGTSGNAWIAGANLNQGLNIGLKSGLIGGLTGGIIGGVTGGIKAINQDREFWSGKKWITTGYDSGTSFSGSNQGLMDWDYQSEMDIPSSSQKGDWDCTWACKKSVDKYFGTTGQESINDKWYDYVKASGLHHNRIENYYRAAGYNTLSFESGFSTSYQAKNALPWIYSKMNANEIIQIGWKPTGTFGHASLITKVKYLADFSKFRIYLMNPSGGTSTLSSFKKIYQIFSISK